MAASLATIRIIAAGETEAAESTPRRSVSKSDIDAVRVELKPRSRDILDLLGLSGSRPGELLGLRRKDINRTGDIWRADLAKRKTAHKGKQRTLFFNQKAQAILLRIMTDDPEAKLFPIRRDSYGHAFKRACERAGITPFVPHEIRHTTATKLVDEVVETNAELIETDKLISFLNSNPKLPKRPNRRKRKAETQSQVPRIRFRRGFTLESSPPMERN